MKFTLKKKRGRRIAQPRSHDLMNPSRDWLFMLALAVLTFGSGVVYVVFDLYGQFGDTDQLVATEQKVEYQAKEVSYYAQMYEEREMEFMRLRKDRHYVPSEGTEEETSVKDSGADSSDPLAEVIMAQ